MHFTVRLSKPIKTYSFRGNASKKKHFPSGFKTYDLALQACLVLKIEINQSGELYSSDFFIKYFILRVLTCHSKFWHANIVWKGCCTDWLLWVPFHVFCCLTLRVHPCMLDSQVWGSFPLRWYVHIWVRQSKMHFWAPLAQLCWGWSCVCCANRTPAEVNWIRQAFYEAMDSVSLH